MDDDVVGFLWLAIGTFVVFSRVPEPDEQPNILQDYANTSSAGSIIAFSHHQDGLESGDLAVICSFGAGYSAGNVIVRKR